MVPYEHLEFGHQRAWQIEIFPELVAPSQVAMAVAVSWPAFVHRGSA
jgi:hypothetical protein